MESRLCKDNNEVKLHNFRSLSAVCRTQKICVVSKLSRFAVLRFQTLDKEEGKSQKRDPIGVRISRLV